MSSHSSSGSHCGKIQNVPSSTRKLSLSVKGAKPQTTSKQQEVYNFHFWKNHPKSPLAIRHYEPLMYAVQHDDLSGAKQLIRLIVDESSSKTLKWLSSLCDDDGNTMAHCAAASDRKNCAQSMLGLLCKFGVYLNGVNKDGITPLDIVAMHGDVDWIREIIALGGRSQIRQRQLLDMKDRDVTRWLTDYQNAVRANGYTQNGPTDDSVDGDRPSHRQFLRKKKSKTSKSKKRRKNVLKQSVDEDSGRKRNVFRIASLSTVPVEKSKMNRLSRIQNDRNESKDDSSASAPSTNIVVADAPKPQLTPKMESTPKVTDSKKMESELPSKSPAESKTNVFAVMHRVNRFKNNLKDKVEDTQHAAKLSKEAPIQRPNVKRTKKTKKSQRPKDWSIQRLRREVYRLKGKLPYFQKYGRRRQLIEYEHVDRLQFSEIETVRDHLVAKHHGFNLNVLGKEDIDKLKEVFGEIDANGNGTVFLTELAAYYQLLTVSNGLYNAAHAMDDVKVLLQIMKLVPEKEGMSVNLWLNLWNLISINFGPLFVNEMLSEYSVFKQHVQGLNPDQKSEKLKNQKKRTKSARSESRSNGAMDTIQQSELCMLFDV